MKDRPNSSIPETLLRGRTVHGLALSSDVLYALTPMGGGYSLQSFRPEDGRALSEVYGPKTDHPSKMPTHKPRPR